MKPESYRPLLLMIHGVNSTLEWSTIVLKILEPHFRCRLIRYRYFHTVWGPVKIYIWPAALLLVLAYLILLWPSLASRASPCALWLLRALLVLEALVVIKAEIEWMRKVEQAKPEWIPPFVFALTGLLGAFLCEPPWQWVMPVAALVGVAVFLDLREYTSEPMSWYTLVCFPGAIMVVVGWVVHDLFARQSMFPAFWVVLGFLVVGFVEPLWRCNLAFSTVRDSIAQARNEYPEPFVIAHSLGTYLTGHIIQETPGLRVGRILFTGCVLDRRYPWQHVGPQGRGCVLSVTNYVGLRDIVPLITGCLRELWYVITFGPLLRHSLKFLDFLGRLITWRPLGMAGFVGFNAIPGLTHKQEEWMIHCRECQSEGLLALVHNLPHPGAHSTQNESKSFQQWSWLPCLWGMSIHEYDDWLSWCQMGSFYSQPAIDTQRRPIQPYQPQDAQGFHRREIALTERMWSWPPTVTEAAKLEGRKLEAYVADIMALRHTAAVARARTARIMKRLPKFIFDTVQEAWDEATRGGTNLDKLQRLHPQAALEHAVLLADR
jgi:hypothetical protein